MTATESLHEELLQLTRDLIAIDSTTGREGAIAQWIAGWFSRHKIEHELVYVSSELQQSWPQERDLEQRPNVCARVRGTNATAAPLVLNGHIDAVPVGDVAAWEHDPFTGHRSDGLIFGRGACDMKAGMAIGMLLMRTLAESDVSLPFDVELQCVIGEESGGIGTHELVRERSLPRAAVILEPTSAKLVTACGGTAPFRIATQGRSAHVGLPWTGVDALEQMIRIHGALRELESHRAASLQHELFDKLPSKAPLSFGTFAAGEWRLTTAADAQLEGRIGTLPDEDLDDVRQQLVAALGTEREFSRAQSVPEPEVTWYPGFSGWELPQDHWLARSLSNALAEQGLDAAPNGVTYASDASAYAAQGVPVALLGPGNIQSAHTINEHVLEKEVVDVFNTLLVFVQSLADSDERNTP